MLLEYNRLSVGDIGELERLTVGHDGRGAGSDWLLEYIEVVAEEAGRSMYFPCGQWIGRQNGQGIMERTLCRSNSNAEDMVTQYEVRCTETLEYTSDECRICSRQALWDP